MFDLHLSSLFSMVPVDEVAEFVRRVGASGMPCSFLAVCACAIVTVHAETTTSRQNFRAVMCEFLSGVQLLCEAELHGTGRSAAHPRLVLLQQKGFLRRFRDAWIARIAEVV